MNNFEKRTNRRYLAEFFSALALYTALVFGAKRLMPDGDTDTLIRAGVALLPMIGIGLAGWAMARHIVRMDELQRKMSMEILVWASAITAFWSLSYGFLEQGIDLPRLSMHVVWLAMAFTWLVVAIVYHLMGKRSCLW
ncbi:MAG: hypothetical protein JNM81_15150 [Rhodospirillaceae bacterium]|nr:hypothetical protein [Rhodospirillaceae bacterium]